MKKTFSLSGKHILSAPLLGLLFVGLALGTVAVSGQPGKSTEGKELPGGTVGRPQIGERGVQMTTGQIMALPRATQGRKQIFDKPELKIPWRENRPQDPKAQPISRFPQVDEAGLSKKAAPPIAQAPQPVGLSFDTITGPTETGSFPPDTMGAVGPTQFILCVNGRLRSFAKAGTADGVLDANTDIFFASVLTPLGGGIAINFTTDPQIRYDRLSGRWFIMMADVPLASDQVTQFPNRIMIAVSDSSTITMGTTWTFYFFQQNTIGGGDTGEFADYPSLGVDNNALYIGCDMFIASTGSFTQTTGFVVRKSSVLTGGPIVVTAFRGLAVGAGDGPFAPRGVDNYDPTANEGYFIGVSNSAFGRLVFRRVSTPGGTPTISANILLTVSSTAFARTVAHLGQHGWHQRQPRRTGR